MKKILTLIILMFSTTAYAEQYYPETYNFYFVDIPSLCGSIDETNRYLKDHNFVPATISLGRTGSKPNGEPVFMITMYINDNDELLAAIDVPTGGERCMLFHTFNNTKVD